VNDSPKDYRKATPGPSRRGAGNRQLRKTRVAAKVFPRRTVREQDKAPAMPLMLRPRQAWEQLCARTGAAICRTSFYNWIKSLKICSVRMGWKIFIPISELDRLVELCLRGDRM